ncbi:MAG: hypothetical protein Q9220_004157 [cf. Caloplaca sp. 1 TL-2023]
MFSWRYWPGSQLLRPSESKAEPERNKATQNERRKQPGDTSSEESFPQYQAALTEERKRLKRKVSRASDSSPRQNSTLLQASSSTMPPRSAYSSKTLSQNSQTVIGSSSGSLSFDSGSRDVSMPISKRRKATEDRARCASLDAYAIKDHPDAAETQDPTFSYTALMMSPERHKQLLHGIQDEFYDSQILLNWTKLTHRYSKTGEPKPDRWVPVMPEDGEGPTVYGNDYTLENEFGRIIGRRSNLPKWGNIVLSPVMKLECERQLEKEIEDINTQARSLFRSLVDSIFLRENGIDEFDWVRRYVPPADIEILLEGIQIRRRLGKLIDAQYEQVDKDVRVSLHGQRK